jgi:hypothetical protein
MQTIKSGCIGPLVRGLQWKREGPEHLFDLTVENQFVILRTLRYCGDIVTIPAYSPYELAESDIVSHPPGRAEEEGCNI